MDALSEARPARSGGPDRSARILVVDDNELVRTLIVTLLERRGFWVVGVDSGEAALTTIPRGFDLVLLDLTLPGMSGLDVCRRLRDEAATATIRIAVLTGRAERGDVRDAIRAGADAYLAKPFETVELLAMVDRLAARPA